MASCEKTGRDWGTREQQVWISDSDAELQTASMAQHLYTNYLPTITFY